MTGKIFNIQRFSTQDGPGIRTVIFLKGCPLKCVWCHNPESHTADTEIFYNPEKCIGCKLCETACTEKQHLFKASQHIFLRDGCCKCQNCTTVCPTGALEVCGAPITVEAALDEVLRDREFYRQSGGGITLSGGEPLMQFDFSLALLKEIKKQGINTAIETCGYTVKNLDEINRYADLWLFDIKLFDKEEHKKYTGVSNEIIFKNLYYLNEKGANIILRCPIIPDVNLTEQHFDRIAELSAGLENVVAVHLEPYHPLGASKAEHLGKKQLYNNKKFLASDTLRPYAEKIQSKINAPVEIL